MAASRIPRRISGCGKIGHKVAGLRLKTVTSPCYALQRAGVLYFVGELWYLMRIVPCAALAAARGASTKNPCSRCCGKTRIL
jgi:hypothetical protein